MILIDSILARLLPSMLLRGIRIRRALHRINRSGGVDEAHHKQWVLDQVVRELTGGGKAYIEWVRAHRDGQDGPHTYEWDVGIPP